MLFLPDPTATYTHFQRQCEQVPMACKPPVCSLYSAPKSHKSPFPYFHNNQNVTNRPPQAARKQDAAPCLTNSTCARGRHPQGRFCDFRQGDILLMITTTYIPCVERMEAMVRHIDTTVVLRTRFPFFFRLPRPPAAGSPFSPEESFLCASAPPFADTETLLSPPSPDANVGPTDLTALSASSVDGYTTDSSPTSIPL